MQTLKHISNKYPNITKGIAIGLMLGASDTTAQLLFEEKYNWKRNFEFLVLGLGWMAPAIQTWYGHLLPRITAKYLTGMSKGSSIVARTFIDNLIFPPISYAGFYILRDLLFRKKESRLGFYEQFKMRFVPTLLADWAIWIPTNFVNFWFVPVQWQGVFVGVFSFFFDIVLSCIANRDMDHSKRSDRKAYLRAKINRFLETHYPKQKDPNWDDWTW